MMSFNSKNGLTILMLSIFIAKSKQSAAKQISQPWSIAKEMSHVYIGQALIGQNKTINQWLTQSR